MPKKIIKDKFYVGLVNELDDTDKRKIKYAKHWTKYGWEPTQLWNLDVMLAEIIHKYLILYKTHSIVNIHFDIDNMILAFALIKEGAQWGGVAGILTFKEANSIINRGLKLFAKHFTALWD